MRSKMVISCHILVHTIHQVVDIDGGISRHLRLGYRLSLWSVLPGATATMITVNSLIVTPLLYIRLFIIGIIAMRSRICILSVSTLGCRTLLALHTMPFARRLSTFTSLHACLHLRIIQSRVIF